MKIRLILILSILFYSIAFCDVIHSNYDIKVIHKGWNWVSFPRLSREGNEPVFADSILLKIKPLNNIFDLILKGADGSYLTYNCGEWNFFGLRHITSTAGYKLNISITDSIYLSFYGNRIEPDTQLYLSGNRRNWIGYFLPKTQYCDEAFGKYWDKVISIQAEDWCYLRPMYNFEKRGYKSIGFLPSNKIRPLEYGRGYVVVVSEDIPDFRWWNSNKLCKSNKKHKPQIFNYKDYFAYEIFDIVNIEQGVSEIAIYRDTTCVGASVVDGSSVQIISYAKSSKIGNQNISFAISHTAGDIRKINNYYVYDFKSGEFIHKNIMAGHQKYAIITMNKNTNINIPSKTYINDNCNESKIQNSTFPTITYELTDDCLVELSVYDIKGNKIRTLVKNRITKGEWKTIWDGRDDNSKRLGNGIYFYKLSAGKKRIIKKMLLMR
ncbi:MAG: hypothetical protein KAW92_04995 [Candidatus Cloacimonetes bacterium]|nr:hypothetical protein [Candidatus Cloacimonadota bacterium]